MTVRRTVRAALTEERSKAEIKTRLCGVATRPSPFAKECKALPWQGSWFAEPTAAEAAVGATFSVLRSKRRR